MCRVPLPGRSNPGDVPGLAHCRHGGHVATLSSPTFPNAQLGGCERVSFGNVCTVGDRSRYLEGRFWGDPASRGCAPGRKRTAGAGPAVPVCRRTWGGGV